MLSNGAVSGVGFVGCGYVADFYQRSIRHYPNIEIVGVYDEDPERLKAHSEYYGVKKYESLRRLLSDPEIDIVLNLTNPRSHKLITEAALKAGKHVYTEKPLALDVNDAIELIQLSEETGRQIACAPCSVLGECAQTVWRELRAGRIGAPCLVYAELDGGMIHRICHTFKSKSGASWPAEDEFQVGCTFEHAGYFLTWLLAFFGPVRRVTAFSSLQIPVKMRGQGDLHLAPDFSVACLEFDNNVVARLTCSIVANLNHELKIVGEEATLLVHEAWDNWAKIEIIPHGSRSGFAVPYKKPPFHTWKWRGDGNRMDFAIGILELSEAIREKRGPRLSAEVGAHVVEVISTIQGQDTKGVSIQSAFPGIHPRD